MGRIWNFKFGKKTILLPLFLNESFRNVALSLLGLFSSVYVYKRILLLSGQLQLAILAVALYYLGLGVFKLLTNLVAEEWGLKYGLKKQIYLGNMFLAFCLISLFFSIRSWPFLIIASATEGVAEGFYWFGRHAMVAKKGDEGSFGSELGIYNFVVTLFSLGVPFLGGLLISLEGYASMFLASLGLVILGTIFLKPVVEEKTVHDTDLKEVLLLFIHLPKKFLAYFGDSAGDSLGGIS